MSDTASAFLQTVLNDNDVLFLAGPSGVGKSALAVDAALRAGAEIVSCDAMQVYREVNIASDKPSAAMRESVPHHLLDVVSVEENFNAALYRGLAVTAIEGILARRRKVIVCGGSGMYMMAILDGLFDGVTVPEGLREDLLARASRDGLSVMHQRLKEIDPGASARINPNDQVRIIRALEVFEATGIPISQLQRTRGGLWGSRPIAIVGLERERAELYARAERRIEAMFASGLAGEVDALILKNLAPGASRLIGIPEVKGFIDGQYGIDRAKELMKLNTRHYIKRQMTWFRKDARIKWVSL